MIALTVFGVLVVSVSCAPVAQKVQEAKPAAPKIDHATALLLHREAVSRHNTQDPLWAVMKVEPTYQRWTGPLAGGDVFWANPAARAFYAPEPTPVQPPPVPVVSMPVQETRVKIQPEVMVPATPVLDHATALRLHADALRMHNTDNLFWAVPSFNSAPEPAVQGYTAPLAGGDVFWANPSAKPMGAFI